MYAKKQLRFEKCAAIDAVKFEERAEHRMLQAQLRFQKCAAINTGKFEEKAEHRMLQAQLRFKKMCGHKHQQI